MTSYRHLSDTEVKILRLALGKFIPVNWERLANWSPELRNPILEAQKELHTQEFEFVHHAGALLHIIAMRSNGAYAITPELQNGIKMEHVRAVLKTFGPWGWRKFLKHSSIEIFILCSSIWFLFSPPEPISWLGEFSVFFVSSWGQICLGSIALSLLVYRLYQDNPVRHYREQAELGHEILTHLSQKTPAEIEADNAHLLRNMPPSAEEIIRSKGGTIGPNPKPA